MIEVVPSTMAHARELAKSIREKDQIEARALGLVPHKALFYAYRHSVLRRTAVVDGSVAAMWGISGTPLGVVGQPYLITGTVCDKIHPVTFAKIYIKELKGMKSLFPVLENYVHSDYEGAVEMLRIAGFELSDPIDINGTSFRRFRMVS
jgi:hypothetical protein